jgi:hypothetical protein
MLSIRNYIEEVSYHHNGLSGTGSNSKVHPKFNIELDGNFLSVISMVLEYPWTMMAR